MVRVENNLLFNIGPRKCYPVFKKNKRVNLAIIEVGCKPDHKRAQLKIKHHTTESLWRDEFEQYGIQWIPQIRRTLIHFDPKRNEKGVLNSALVYNPDTVIFYKTVTDEDLSLLTEGQLKRIISDRPKKINLFLKDIFQRSSSQDLQDLIINDPENKRLKNFRGRLGEILALNKIHQYMPDGNFLVRNGDLMCLRKKLLKSDLEVDGIVVHYDPLEYWELIKNLQNCDQVEVYVDRNKESPDWIDVI